MNNNPYMNPYINTYNQQPINNMQPINNYDEYLKYLEKEKERIEKSKEQYMNRFQQQPAINQTFQLAPNSHTMRYANTIDDVSKETVYFDTPFFSKDMSVLWVKGVNGDIKTYELKEIVKKDEKDIQIELLQAQINEMKGMIENARTNNEYANEPVESTESTDVQPIKSSTKKSKESRGTV